MSAVGDLSSGSLARVAELRRARQAEAAAATSSGYDGIMLDVDAYRTAMTKFGQETEARKEQWRTLRG
eukprot:6618646-Lingulodinium_polyedra.AAC.1